VADPSRRQVPRRPVVAVTNHPAGDATGDVASHDLDVHRAAADDLRRPTLVRSGRAGAGPQHSVRARNQDGDDTAPCSVATARFTNQPGWQLGSVPHGADATAPTIHASPPAHCSSARAARHRPSPGPPAKHLGIDAASPVRRGPEPHPFTDQERPRGPAPTDRRPRTLDAAHVVVAALRRAMAQVGGAHPRTTRTARPRA
jgi:hypothetical protein